MPLPLWNKLLVFFLWQIQKFQNGGLVLLQLNFMVSGYCFDDPSHIHVPYVFVERVEKNITVRIACWRQLYHMSNRYVMPSKFTKNIFKPGVAHQVCQSWIRSCCNTNILKVSFVHWVILLTILMISWFTDSRTTSQCSILEHVNWNNLHNYQEINIDK